MGGFVVDAGALHVGRRGSARGVRGPPGSAGDGGARHPGTREFHVLCVPRTLLRLRRVRKREKQPFDPGPKPRHGRAHCPQRDQVCAGRARECGLGRVLPLGRRHRGHQRDVLGAYALGAGVDGGARVHEHGPSVRLLREPSEPDGAGLGPDPCALGGGVDVLRDGARPSHGDPRVAVSGDGGERHKPRVPRHLVGERRVLPRLFGHDVGDFLRRGPAGRGVRGGGRAGGPGAWRADGDVGRGRGRQQFLADHLAPGCSGGGAAVVLRRGDHERRPRGGGAPAAVPVLPLGARHPRGPCRERAGPRGARGAGQLHAIRALL
mmetsp:Transcript_87876/g.175783  ORF Transcript_87876/g.175783 Transcript_87876/m.175783 type:complete len:321 (+) Transcript_87876:608-1570(+)